MPFIPHTDDDVRELRHGYYAATTYLDVQVGKVLHELDRLALRDTGAGAARRCEPGHVIVEGRDVAAVLQDDDVAIA